MKLYVKAGSRYQDNLETIDLKKELKLRYKLDTRRQDSFIHMGLLGALRLKEKTTIDSCDELYITSGYGNLDVLQKVHQYVIGKKELIKLFDFINILGNTTGFYVASSLGIKSKSIFQISDNFTYFHSLIMIYTSLLKSHNEAILASIDIVGHNDEVMRQIAHIEKNMPIASGVNFQKLSLDAAGAVCSLEFDTMFYTRSALREKLADEGCRVVSSMRCSELQYETASHYFETDASYVVNEAVENKEDIIYVECYNEKYKILKIVSLQ